MCSLIFLNRKYYKVLVDLPLNSHNYPHYHSTQYPQQCSPSLDSPHTPLHTPGASMPCSVSLCPPHSLCCTTRNYPIRPTGRKDHLSSDMACLDLDTLSLWRYNGSFCTVVLCRVRRFCLLRSGSL